MKRDVTSRRAFLAKSIIATGGVILSSQLVACERLDDFLGGGQEEKVPRFLHGVGSFDPTSKAVIIWTRFTPTEDEVGKMIPIKWQVATDASFANVVKEGIYECSIVNDFTVVEDVTGLASNGTFYYRFMQEELKVESVVGETITLPSAGHLFTV